MKRLKILLVLLLSFSLTGCVQKITIKEEQDVAVAEFMAGLLLSNDNNYDQKLIPQEDISEEDLSDNNLPDLTDSSEIDTEEGDTSEVNQQDYTLVQVLGEKEFSVQYKGYKLVDTYPEDEESANFSLTPREGYQLLVASFAVKNTSESKKEINLIQSGVTYQLKISDSIYKPLLTLLENDLQYFDLTIAPDKSKKALLIFEVPKDIDIANIDLKATKENKSMEIELK